MHGSPNRGDYLLELAKRLVHESAPSAWEKRIARLVESYLKSHPVTSRLEATLAVLKAQKMAKDGSLDAAIQRAREREVSAKRKKDVARRAKKSPRRATPK
jgi:hypothetical protein